MYKRQAPALVDESQIVEGEILSDTYAESYDDPYKPAEEALMLVPERSL